ncbi:MAG: hypothetical protein M1827_000547 [Pycnora praestabilis]|nr:MAG: hypothetical protein M1827_000547 [Pycnora praestabilis]
MAPFSCFCIFSVISAIVSGRATSSLIEERDSLVECNGQLYGHPEFQACQDALSTMIPPISQTNGVQLLEPPGAPLYYWITVPVNRYAGQPIDLQIAQQCPRSWAPLQTRGDQDCMITISRNPRQRPPSQLLDRASARMVYHAAKKVMTECVYIGYGGQIFTGLSNNLLIQVYSKDSVWGQYERLHKFCKQASRSGFKKPSECEDLRGGPPIQPPPTTPSNLMRTSMIGGFLDKGPNPWRSMDLYCTTHEDCDDMAGLDCVSQPVTIWNILFGTKVSNFGIGTCMASSGKDL